MIPEAITSPQGDAPPQAWWAQLVTGDYSRQIAKEAAIYWGVISRQVLQSRLDQVPLSCREFLYQILYAFPDFLDCLSEVPMFVFALLDIFGGYPCVLLDERKARQYGFYIVLGSNGGIVLVERVYFAHWWVLSGDRFLFAADGERGCAMSSVAETARGLAIRL